MTNAPDSRMLRDEDDFRRLVAHKDGVDDGTKSILKTSVILPATMCVVNFFFFLEAHLEVESILHSERWGMSCKTFTHALLSVNTESLRKHEHYESIVNTPRGTTVV